jgi:hypothetical protein
MMAFGRALGIASITTAVSSVPMQRKLSPAICD